MGNRIAKNESFRYTLFSHSARIEHGVYYCRAMNFVVPEDVSMCGNCPLYGGSGMDRNGQVYSECWYFDLEAGYADLLGPEEQKIRTDGLMAAGIVEAFPEYLEEDERGRKFLLIERAVRFAANAHAGDIRKGTKLPYISHPVETMMLVARELNDNEVIAAAVLHDVVEDTPVTLQQIQRVFGERVAELVSMETENKREDQPKEATWKIRKQENLEREKDASMEAKLIMLADKVSNLRSTLRDMEQNGPDVWTKFNMSDPKEQEWYYRSVAEVLVELSDRPLYQEYLSLLKRICP